MFNRQFLLAGTAGILVFGLAQPATAQEAADNNEDVITILGEKIERSLQDTPTSVAVTTAERIENENIRTLFDIVNRTANVGETYGPTEFTIRGISSNNVSGGGTGGLASIYVDGVAVPDGVTGTSAGPFNMWDVEQVEILRGPQSTLQGRNSLAGAIVVQSLAPTREWDARARLSATDQDDVTLSFAGGGPIVEDQVAFRIAIENREFDGIVDNPTRGGTVDGVSNLHARARLLIEPDAVPGLSILGSYTHYEQESGYPYTYIRTDTPDFFDNRINTSDAPNSNDSTTDMVTLNVDYELTDRIVPPSRMWKASRKMRGCDRRPEISRESSATPVMPTTKEPTECGRCRSMCRPSMKADQGVCAGPDQVPSVSAKPSRISPSCSSA